MMSVETMRSVNPKTVDRSTLVQRDSIRLEPAAAQDDRLRILSDRSETRIAIWTGRPS